jgi:hypothetical protein
MIAHDAKLEISKKKKTTKFKHAYTYHNGKNFSFQI